jgi:hypothetical protein
VGYGADYLADIGGPVRDNPRGGGPGKPLTLRERKEAVLGRYELVYADVEVVAVHHQPVGQSGELYLLPGDDPVVVLGSHPDCPLRGLDFFG